MNVTALRAECSCGAARRMPAAAIHAECKQRRCAPSAHAELTRRVQPIARHYENGHKIDLQALYRRYPTTAAARRRCPALRPTTHRRWRGGWLCAPLLAAKSLSPALARSAAPLVTTALPSPAALRLTAVAAAITRFALLRAIASVRHIAAYAGAQCQPTRHRRCAGRNAGHRRRASAVTNVNWRSHLATAGVYNCKLPQASRAQAAEYQPSSAPLVKYYEGKSVRCAPNLLAASRLHV